MTETQEAQATVDRYRTTQGQATGPVYMAYMRARQVLDRHGIDRFTAGQRGFMAAARGAVGGPTAGALNPPVSPAPANFTAPEAAPAQHAETMEEPPEWATEQ